MVLSKMPSSQSHILMVPSREAEYSCRGLLGLRRIDVTGFVWWSGVDGDVGDVACVWIDDKGGRGGADVDLAVGHGRSCLV